LRSLPDGTPVINLALAYDYGTKKNERGYLPSQFIEAGLWGKRAAALEQHLNKGGRIFASISDIHIETFRKGDGSEGHKLTGRIQDLEFAGDGRREEGHQEAPQRAPAPQQRQRPAPAPARAPAPSSGFDDMDDDIPF
jgi:single-strand DNA-binding protein